MLVWLTHKDKQKIYEVSKLHQLLLADSPIPQLGESFMTEFYYSELIKNDLIKCLTFVKENKVREFIVITMFPESFMLMGIKKAPIKLIINIFKAVFRKPTRLFLLFSMLGLALKRKSSIASKSTAELLSIGILKECRNNIDSKTGLKISHALFNESVKYLQVNKREIFQVLTDKTNTAAVKYYKNMKMKLKSSKFYDTEKQLLFYLSLTN